MLYSYTGSGRVLKLVAALLIDGKDRRVTGFSCVKGVRLDEGEETLDSIQRRGQAYEQPAEEEEQCKRVVPK